MQENRVINFYPNAFDPIFWESRHKNTQAWHHFHTNNPKVFQEICKYADKMAKTRTHYSIETIIHVLRYHRDIDTVSEDHYKINNNHKVFYSRLYMRLRDLEGFFSVKEESLANEINWDDYIRVYGRELGL